MLMMAGVLIVLRFQMFEPNVCFIKNRTKHSFNTLLKLVRFFMKH